MRQSQRVRSAENRQPSSPPPHFIQHQQQQQTLQSAPANNDDRPIVSSGRYNLNFFDTNNEYELATSSAVARHMGGPPGPTPGPSTAFRSALSAHDVDAGYNEVFLALAMAPLSDAEFHSRFPYDRLLALDQGLEQSGGLSTSALRVVLRRTRRARAGEECSICLSTHANDERRLGRSCVGSVTPPVCVLPCGHVYHCVCIQPWLQTHSTCPMCRATVRGE